MPLLYGNQRGGPHVTKSFVPASADQCVHVRAGDQPVEVLSELIDPEKPSREKRPTSIHPPTHKLRSTHPRACFQPQTHRSCTPKFAVDEFQSFAPAPPVIIAHSPPAAAAARSHFIVAVTPARRSSCYECCERVADRVLRRRRRRATTTRTPRATRWRRRPVRRKTKGTL